MEENKKPSYLEDIKDNLVGAFWLIIFFGAIIFIFSLFHFKDPDAGLSEKQKNEKWNKQYSEHGNTDPDIEVHQQYGGR